MNITSNDDITHRVTPHYFWMNLDNNERRFDYPLDPRSNLHNTCCSRLDYIITAVLYYSYLPSCRSLNPLRFRSYRVVLSVLTSSASRCKPFIAVQKLSVQLGPLVSVSPSVHERTYPSLSASFNVFSNPLPFVVHQHPSGWDVPQLETLMESGMNVARLNFSHGDHAGHGAVLERVRQAAKNKNKSVGTYE